MPNYKGREVTETQLELLRACGEDESLLLAALRGAIRFKNSESYRKTLSDVSADLSCVQLPRVVHREQL